MSEAEQAAGGTGERPWWSQWTTDGRYCVVQEVDKITVMWGAGVAWDSTEFDKVRAALAAPPSEPLAGTRDAVRLQWDDDCPPQPVRSSASELRDALWAFAKRRAPNEYGAFLSTLDAYVAALAASEPRNWRESPSYDPGGHPAARPSEPLAGTRGDAAIETLAGEVECAAVSLETAYGGKARAIRQAMESVRTEWNRLRAASAPPETDGVGEIAHLAALLDAAMRGLRQAETTPINIAKVLYREGVRAARPSPGARTPTGGEQ